MLKRAYDWCVSYASHPAAPWLLFALTFVESSISPLPPIPLLLPMCIARPDRAVVALCGDGGFLFTVQELGTAAELGLPLPILVWNNDAFGQIAQNMRDVGIPEIAVKQKNPDFQKLAAAYGIRAVRPDSLAGIEAALREAFAASGPTLIEVREDSGFLD